ncbi:cytosolic protein [Bacillus sp. ISL-47]|uniref:cytosolic protein n=1 Tax=Bacillus sp. ISL-47 TaxID=2819130 RepID=UPI001BE71E76|nr:cytosolic protein [Bacillus sp. ISL-47]MBT2691006.1 cytosolic protein [Bacillus sp. ISL-47]MBT2710900.1 hypothetical protein [Pseudomonas sp. ISL-84]
MKTFTVNFHNEDQVQPMHVQKLSEKDFEQYTEGGTRHLFELDTNIGYFIFFDGLDNDGQESYMVLQYEEDQDEPSACYAFELKDFYQFTALHLNDLDFNEENDQNEDEELYTPIQHLAHLMYHISEEGKKIEV